MTKQKKPTNKSKSTSEKSQNIPIIAKLTSKQRLILVALVANSISGEYKTEKEIAKLIGVDPSTIYEFRHRPDCMQALHEYLDTRIPPQPDRIIAKLIQEYHKGNMKAIDSLLKIAGVLK